MKKKLSRFHVGLRTIKTVAAVIISMAIVDYFGATSSKLIFAMLGAMAAVQPTYKESLESCITQIVSVLFGALLGVLLLNLPVSHLIATGIGIILVITIYNAFRINFPPSLACLIIVSICTTPDIQPITYALGRIWDTAIGLGVGMAINILVFPYDNSRQIRNIVKSLDLELIYFLEELFDGDDILPDTDKMLQKINAIERNLRIFSNQKLLMHQRRQHRELATFQRCENTAHELIVQMEVLCRMGKPGRLTEENRRRLSAFGAVIRDKRTIDIANEKDIVTNYHMNQLMTSWQELLVILGTE